MERFIRWLRLKQLLHQQKHKPPFISEGDIWWASIGENVGREINGKSERFSRPVIVYKKLSRETFLAIPASTQTGNRYEPHYVQYTHNNVCAVACLNQIRVIDYRRISSKLGSVNDTDMQNIKVGFARLYI